MASARGVKKGEVVIEGWRDGRRDGGYERRDRARVAGQRAGPAGGAAGMLEPTPAAGAPDRERCSTKRFVGEEKWPQVVGSTAPYMVNTQENSKWNTNTTYFALVWNPLGATWHLTF